MELVNELTAIAENAGPVAATWLTLKARMRETAALGETSMHANFAEQMVKTEVVALARAEGLTVTEPQSAVAVFSWKSVEPGSVASPGGGVVR